MIAFIIILGPIKQCCYQPGLQITNVSLFVIGIIYLKSWIHFSQIQYNHIYLQKWITNFSQTESSVFPLMFFFILLSAYLVIDPVWSYFPKFCSS